MSKQASYHALCVGEYLPAPRSIIIFLTFSMAGPGPVVFQFGVFELSKGTGELRKDGVSIRLPPQPAQILVLLVERAGEIVTRQEIQEVAWPDGNTVVDFELGLNRCIRRIRSSLLDDADAPRYIETVPRVGYRFVAPVTVRNRIQQSPPKNADEQHVEAAPPSVQSAPTPVAPLPSATAGPKAKRPLVIGGGLFLLFLVAGVFWFLSHRPSAIQSNLVVMPLSSELGTAHTPTFSPDGRQVAFIWNGKKQDNFDIYVKLVGAQDQVKLVSNPALDYSPAWSPDGKYIAFCRSGDGAGGTPGAIFLVSPLGGAERQIANIQMSASPDLQSLSWSPDATRIAFPDDPANQGKPALFLLDIQTGEKKQLTFPESGEVDMFPAISPDGHSLAFTRDTGRGISSIYLLSLGKDGAGAGKPTRLVWKGFEHVANARPVWTPDSKQIVFASNRNGEHQLWAVKADASAQPTLLGSLGTGVMEAAISSGGRLALVRTTLDSNIWKLEIGRTKAATKTAPVQVVASTRIESNPRISPDGLKIAFESNRAGYTEIWTCNVDGSNLTALTAMASPVTGSPTWSRDGSQIAFDSRAEGGPRLYVIPSTGGKPIALTEGSTTSAIPNWSPDGERIYFTSHRSGNQEIWQMPASGGAAERVSLHGGFAAMPSPDGRSLYYTADHHPVSSLRVLDLSARQEDTIATGVLPRGFFPVSDGVYYVAGSSYSTQTLHFFQTSSRTSQTLFTFGKPVMEGIGLTPDGKQLFYSQIDYTGSELLWVENFWH
jgi:Tol biopolymer transport system component/DNA-binding winged helix-turn-helix (wHTH) protein